MSIKQTDQKLKKFFASSTTRKWISEPDEVQLQDIVRRRAKKALGNAFVITVSAISDLEPAIKREILNEDVGTVMDPNHCALELFQMTLKRHRKGVLCVCDLESIDAECLVFLGRLVDLIKASKSEWKVVYSGEPQHLSEACLQRLGIRHKKGKSVQEREHSDSEWSETIISILNTRVI